MVAGILSSFKPYNYESEWKKVEEKGLYKPKTALNKIAEIKQHAVAEKNLQQQLNCILIKSHYDNQIESEENAVKTCLTSLNDFLAKQKDPVIVSLTRYALSMNYYSYMEKSDLSDRTDLMDTIPDNIDEWTTKTFRDTIKTLHKLALSEPAIRKALCKDYNTLLILDQDSRHCPTLYDFLASYTLNNFGYGIYGQEEDLQLVNEWIKFHEDDADRSAYVYAQLQKIDLAYCESEEQEIKDLEQLLADVKDCDASVDVRIKLAGKLYNQLLYERNKNTSVEYIAKICNEVIAKCPKHKNVDSLKDILKFLKRERIQLSLANEGGTVHTGDKVRIALSYANIKNLKLTLMRYKCTPEEWAKKSHDRLSVKKVNDYSFNLAPSQYCILRDTVLELPAQDFGAYRVCVCDSFIDMVVTNHFLLGLSEKSDEMQFVIVDSKTGRPMPQVTAQNWYEIKGKLQSDTVISNDSGFVSLNRRYHSQDSLLLRSGKDEFFYINHYGNIRPVCNNTRENETIAIFTDRSVYRPGQTVHFKLIDYKNKPYGEFKVNHSLDIRVKDVNDQIINKIYLKTDQYGAVSDSFALPVSCLSGTFKIEVYSSSLYPVTKRTFWVEEYKRPTFDIALQHPSGAFTFGDTVHIKGTAAYLMGAPLQNAKVSYSVKCNPVLYFWWIMSDYESGVSDGTVQTDENGNFEFSFVPTKKVTRKTFHSYEIEVRITDANGETHYQTISMTVGDETMAIESAKKEKMLMSELSAEPFRVVNLDYEGINREVTYSICREETEVAMGNVMSDSVKGFTLPVHTDEWQSGRYTIRLSVTDDRKQVCSREIEVVLYRSTDQHPPVACALWTENMGRQEVEKGDSVAVRVGTTLSHAQLLVVEISDSGKVKKQWMNLDNEIKTLKYVLESGLNAQVQFYLVHDGKLHQDKLHLAQKLPERKFPMQLSVFRDKVQPGSKQHWKLSIPLDSIGVNVKKKVTSKSLQVLASMYDASLDEIMPHSWDFHPEFKQEVIFNGYIKFSLSLPNDEYKKDDYYHYVYWENTEDYNNWRYLGLMTEINVCDNAVVNEKSVLLVAGDNGDTELPSYRPPVKKTSILMGNVPAEGSDTEPVKVRRNFEETAFFYPALYADKKGNVTIDFTMPESLTKWKLMALAHGMVTDKKSHQDVLRYGMLTQEIVSQQDFMISPNYPRFLRQGDHGVFTAKIVNLSDKAQHGTAIVEWLNPETEEVIAKQETDFQMEPKKNGVVEWELDVPRNVEAVLMRVSAKTSHFADAEQQILPVLTDRVVVTQCLPMYVHGGQTKNYELTSLAQNESSSLNTRFLKLEMTTSPIWNAIECLPVLVDPAWNNSVSLSSAYFASQMSQALVKANPRIFEIISAWKKQSGDQQTLVSNLMKNEEVKQILLNETPWVMEAENETAQKQRLSLLLDAESLSAKSEILFNRLNKLLNNDGGYSWFGNMPSDEYITLFVLDNYGRLMQDKIPVNYRLNTSETLIYIDRMQYERYERMENKKLLDNYRLSMHDLYYLQVRSLFEPLDKEEVDTRFYDFFYQKVKKSWSGLSLYGKAMAATVLYRGGDKDEAAKVVRSLRECATITDEMGMYWEKNVSSWLWEEDAIATHTAIMEALQLVDANKTEQDNLRIWLLNQKRTQSWDNIIATIDALRVLLKQGSDWTKTDNNKIEVKLGGKTVAPDNTETGTGYFSQTVEGKDVKPEMAKVELKSETGGNLSWGGLYWQFEEDMDKVKQNKTGLSVEKSVMLKVSHDGKDMLQRVKEGTLLKVGDQLVMRLVVRADRDFEYVMLKDQRASCLEPMQQLSGCHYQGGTIYYQTVKDASMCFFFDHLSKGTYVFEYPLNITHRGSYSNGITIVQCLYAPEFSSNTGSVRIQVVGKIQ